MPGLFLWRIDVDILQRIMKRVKIKEIPHPVLGTYCWEWQGTKTGGYGRIYVNRKMKLVHRVVYEATYLVDCGDLCVLHRCDNPSCCNPDHLFIGTMADNCRDRDEKGRQITLSGDSHWSKSKPEKVRRGESHGFAKITDAQVEQIKSIGKSMKQRGLAAMFGCSQAQIWNILNEKQRRFPSR